MKYIKILIPSIVIIVLTFFSGSLDIVSNIMAIFFPKVNKYLYILVFLSFIFIMGKTIIKTEKKHMWDLIIIYSLLLFLTLFFREEYQEYQFIEDFYLSKWLQFLLKNKIVFVNITGNILLFIPLGFIFVNYFQNKILSGLLGIALIVILEWLQFLTKRGVLDIVDIFLNSLGLILGVLVTKKGDFNLCMTKMKKKMRLKKKNKS